MRIKYFEDIDTKLVEFSTNTPVETQEFNENIYLDLDSEGRVVSITIEHAGQSADMREFLYQEFQQVYLPHKQEPIQRQSGGDYSYKTIPAYNLLGEGPSVEGRES